MTSAPAPPPTVAAVTSKVRHQVDGVVALIAVKLSCDQVANTGRGDDTSQINTDTGGCTSFKLIGLSDSCGTSTVNQSDHKTTEEVLSVEASEIVPEAGGVAVGTEIKKIISL